MTDKYTYDIKHHLIKKDGNYLAKIPAKDSKRVIEELNRLDRQNMQQDRKIRKIKEIIL